MRETDDVVASFVPLVSAGGAAIMSTEAQKKYQIGSQGEIVVPAVGMGTFRYANKIYYCSLKYTLQAPPIT